VNTKLIGLVSVILGTVRKARGIEMRRRSRPGDPGIASAQRVGCGVRARR